MPGRKALCLAILRLPVRSDTRNKLTHMALVNSRGMRATRSRAYGARESVENTWFLQLLEIDLGSPETAIRVPVSAQFERCFMVI